MRHLSDNLAQMSDTADQEQKQLEVKDQQIEKLQKALDQEQQLNAISQRNAENLSNQIESQRLQLEKSQRPKPLMARLKAVFVAEWRLMVLQRALFRSEQGLVTASF